MCRWRIVLPLQPPRAWTPRWRLIRPTIRTYVASLRCWKPVCHLPLLSYLRISLTPQWVLTVFRGLTQSLCRALFSTRHVRRSTWAKRRRRGRKFPFQGRPSLPMCHRCLTDGLCCQHLYYRCLPLHKPPQAGFRVVQLALLFLHGRPQCRRRWKHMRHLYLWRLRRHKRHGRLGRHKRHRRHASRQHHRRHMIHAPRAHLQPQIHPCYNTGTHNRICRGLHRTLPQPCRLMEIHKYP